ncbi:hypothetical protein SAMN05444369_102208 [Capnocytophaga haemolytica]|jgi:hypothetical protein|uniref:Uncharacterized protein n=1 Tax=Capnocytophaga haemolytica TaxID=45243 RepID=A0AAX2GWR9_9FLAO|nr:hypothetical protein [Capnocytophaga haemolytica]SFN77531.1 hypothetical protein SAMN05444369_102208 [Capnocytophaga haemolytica]SNV06601.1 Uncharacterised protein [Capnocytophaga haemolytica]
MNTSTETNKMKASALIRSSYKPKKVENKNKETETKTEKKEKDK